MGARRALSDRAFLPWLQVPARSRASRAPRPTSGLKAARGERGLLDAGGPAPPLEPGGGAQSPSQQEAAPAARAPEESRDSQGQTAAEAPKKTRGRKKKAAGGEGPRQPEGRGPGRRRRRTVGSASGTAQQLLTNQTFLLFVQRLARPPGEAPASAPGSRPAPEDVSSGSQEVQGPITARSPVTTVSS